MATTTSTSGSGGDPREQTLPAPGATPERSLGRTLARIARLTGFAVLMAGLGYAGGRIHARLEAGDVQAQIRAAAEENARSLQRTQAAHQVALGEARAAVERAEAQRTRLADSMLLYEAYRVIQHALDALDARNFGIAEAELRSLEPLLAPLAPRIDGLPQLLTQSADVKVVVTDNLAPQRQAIAAMARRLDELISAQRAGIAPQ